MGVVKTMGQGLHSRTVARKTGLSIDAVRFHERVENLLFLQKAKAFVFSLNEIRELLVFERTNCRGCSHVRDLLGQKLRRVKEKLTTPTPA